MLDFIAKNRVARGTCVRHPPNVHLLYTWYNEHIGDSQNFPRILRLAIGTYLRKVICHAL